jgi:hypothetical protein
MLKDSLNEYNYQLKKIDRDLEIKYQILEGNLNEELLKLRQNEDEKLKLK